AKTPHIYCLYAKLMLSINKENVMFPNYKGKLQAIMWMGVGSALLSSIFSAFLISIAIKTNRKLNQLSKR
ncbi:hypothetical protein, partial [Cytobacillus firmus]